MVHDEAIELDSLNEQLRLSEDDEAKGEEKEINGKRGVDTLQSAIDSVGGISAVVNEELTLHEHNRDLGESIESTDEQQPPVAGPSRSRSSSSESSSGSESRGGGNSGTRSSACSSPDVKRNLNAADASEGRAAEKGRKERELDKSRDRARRSEGEISDDESLSNGKKGARRENESEKKNVDSRKSRKVEKSTGGNNGAKRGRNARSVSESTRGRGGKRPVGRPKKRPASTSHDDFGKEAKRRAEMESERRQKAVINRTKERLAQSMGRNFPLPPGQFHSRYSRFEQLGHERQHDGGGYSQRSHDYGGEHSDSRGHSEGREGRGHHGAGADVNRPGYHQGYYTSHYRKK